mgnify:CR=1 FL=1
MEEEKEYNMEEARIGAAILPTEYTVRDAMRECGVNDNTNIFWGTDSSTENGL